MNAEAASKSDAPHVETGAAKTVSRGLKLGAESVVPGASLILDGKVGAGALHVFGAGLARTLLGPAGIALVALNSYSKSVSGKYLHQRILPS